MKKDIKIAFSIAFVALLSLTGCGKDEILISGRTMGTTYHITIITDAFKKGTGLKEKIDKRLLEINQSMSTYMEASEISKFNAMKSTDEKLHISDDFFQVLILSKKLHEVTHGAWDGTIKPLVNLWGFGNSKKRARIPKKEEISALLAQTGFDNIEISEEKYLRKKNASISLDLASVAKGYGVDQIAELIKKNGFKDFLVEIGGEVFASGLRKDGGHWRVGINTPRPGAAYDAVYKTVSLFNRAFATSGDYRNFFEADGKRYSHILDPATGYPVTNGVVSVSVKADNCTLADGLATALMVMGHEKGLDRVSRLSRVECMIVVQEADGSLTDYYSKGF